MSTPSRPIAQCRGRRLQRNAGYTQFLTLTVKTVLLEAINGAADLLDKEASLLADSPVCAPMPILSQNWFSGLN
jgi:hypothetical protein